MRTLICIFCILISPDLIAQNRNNIWSFGDSAGIDFSSLNNPIPLHSAVKSRGSCVSICDTNSNLLFYAFTRAGISGNTTLVKNKNDSLMINCNNIVGEGWYLELLIIPFPNDTSSYFLFSIGVTGSSQKGLFYSTIDMTLDSGRGAVVQKNVQLLSDSANDGLIAVKHGNGRDWWILFRNYNAANNTFYKYLVTPAGVSGPFLQNIGTPIWSGFQRFSFNREGNKLGVVTYGGQIETFDFDRCTGMLSNYVLIKAVPPAPPYPLLWSCEFSPNGRFLYVSSKGNPTSYLIQIDLQDITPWANADTIWSDSTYIYYAGAIKLAPDDKIYFSCNWNNGITYNFPYPDTLSNYVINNLSVINTPDSPGTACNFTPFSFYLGGNRTYLGLPNNPDYDMKPLYGSVCDSLSAGIESPPTPKGGEMFVTYISEWDKLFVNAQKLKGTTYTLNVIDITGRQVYKEKGRLHPPYFTKDLDCSAFAKGMYIVSLQTEREVMSKKFIKE